MECGVQVDNIKFDDSTKKARKDEVDRLAKNELPAVFNKRLFTCPDRGRDAVYLTSDSRKILLMNARNQRKTVPNSTAKDARMIKHVVDGLKSIHKNLSYIKDCLSVATSYEEYGQFEYITKKTHEDVLSCYFIIRGMVEVTYDSPMEDAVQVFERNIIYTHGTGEYLGLLSHRGRSHDMEPPATIYTKGPCEFLRIDRKMFHSAMDKAHYKLIQEIKDFWSRTTCIFTALENQERKKFVRSMVKQKYFPNQVIIHQGQATEWLHVVAEDRFDSCRRIPRSWYEICYDNINTGSRRCSVYGFEFVGDDHARSNCKYVRTCHIKQHNTRLHFDIGLVKTGDVLSVECMTGDQPSHCSVLTVGSVTCYKLHKKELESLSQDRLLQLLKRYERPFPSDDDLQNRGRENLEWKRLKSDEVISVLGKTRRWRGPFVVYNQLRMVKACQKMSLQEKHFNFLLGGNMDSANMPDTNSGTTASDLDSSVSETDANSQVGTDKKRIVHFDRRPVIIYEDRESEEGENKETDYNFDHQSSIEDSYPAPNFSGDGEATGGVLGGIMSEHQLAITKYAFSKYRTEVLRRRLQKTRERNLNDANVQRHRRMTQVKFEAIVLAGNRMAFDDQSNSREVQVTKSELINRHKQLIRQETRKNLFEGIKNQKLLKRQASRRSLLLNTVYRQDSYTKQDSEDRLCTTASRTRSLTGTRLRRGSERSHNT